MLVYEWLKVWKVSERLFSLIKYHFAITMLQNHDLFVVFTVESDISKIYGNES
jgi:hypothetical protein